jgi:hypothetical protein
MIERERQWFQALSLELDPLCVLHASGGWGTILIEELSLARIQGNKKAQEACAPVGRDNCLPLGSESSTSLT